LVLVLAAALAGLSFVPDARHERIERTPPPATTQSSPGGTSPDTAPSPAPSTAKAEDGSPVAATPAAAGSAPESDPISPAATTATGPAAAAAAGSAMPAPSPPPATGMAPDTPATGASPVVPAPTPAPAPAKNDDGPPGPRHYVTFGTFAPPASAEALRARLEAQGIPTVLETRLRVGPFATREEAQAAHTRLKELGFAPGAVLSPKR
jgi:cell division protein FtsN